MQHTTGKQHIPPLAHLEPPARRQALGAGLRLVPGGRFSPANANRSHAAAERDAARNRHLIHELTNSEVGL